LLYLCSESHCAVLTDYFYILLCYDSIIFANIKMRNLLIKRNFQHAALQVRHSVTLVVFDQPGWQCGRRKSVIAGRNAKIKDGLPRYKNALSQNVRENFSQPSAARKHELVGGERLAGVAAIDARESSRIACRAHFRKPVIHSEPQ